MKSEKKIAKLFMSGRSQAIRLPKEFRMEGEEVSIQKSGNTLIIIPKTFQDSWGDWYESFNKMSGTLPEREDLQTQQEREAFNDFA
jgi:antitoxin VapB